MATYFFETITPAQALAFSSATDTLIFSTPAATGAGMRVIYTAATPASQGTLSVLSLANGQTVVFGVGLAGAGHVVFPDGSAFAIGLPGAGSFQGGPKGDGFAGSGGPDFLDGQGGDDVLGGGEGADSLLGGAGQDLFIVVAGASPAAVGQMDVVLDWAPEDRLSFAGPAGGPANYAEASANTFAEALAFASSAISGGVVDYVSVQVAGDVVVFADSRGDNGAADDAVTLRSRTLDFIGASNIVTTMLPPAIPGPPIPPLLPGVTASITGILDNVHLSHLLGADIDVATPTRLVLNGLLGTADLVGTGFVYDFNEQLVGGTVTQLTFAELGVQAGVVHGLFTGLAFSAAPLGAWVATDATQTAFAAILANNDTVNGSSGVDLLRGYDGADLLLGDGGHDTIWGGNGDDTISATLPPGVSDLGQGQTYLRGEAGNDRIFGGPGFDDTHGNIGDDTVSGGGADDWVVGGQGNDVLFGDDGGDLCYGNLGQDTIDGGAGDDAVVGGQANDVLFGGAGNDFITGDRGDDILMGGAGADTFRTFNQTGIDRVNDFNQAEGDRVQVDVGNAYTLSQIGLDTVVDLGGGNRLILAGVLLSSLTAGWITGG